METSTKYQNHINIMKDLQLSSDFYEVREPYKEDFEKIYEEAKSADVKVSTAKDFLKGLSDDEISTLQHYTRLADEVNVDELSNEGAYNLLMHVYEKYDFDNDGVIEDAQAKTRSLIPQNIDDDVKEALVNALNSTDEDMFMVMAVLSFDQELFKHQLAQDIQNMSEAQKDYMREHASFDIDKFIEETLSKPFTPKKLTYEDFMEKIDDILNPKNGGYSSAQLKEKTAEFSELFQNEYAKIQEEKTHELKNSVLVNELTKNFEPKNDKSKTSLESLIQEKN